MIAQTCGKHPNIPANLRFNDNKDAADFDNHNNAPSFTKNNSSTIIVEQLFIHNVENKDNILYLCHFMAHHHDELRKIALLIIFVCKVVCKDFMSPTNR